MNSAVPGRAPQQTIRPGRPPGGPLVAGVLLLLCMVTAFGVVFAAHRARELFRELEGLRRDENETQIEWRQLLLERSTLSSQARVEAIAGSELKMAAPEGPIHPVPVE